MQETIFVADGGEDYLRDCNKSGEPLISSMRPDHYDDSLPFIQPYVKTLVGPPRSHSAYEVRNEFAELVYIWNVLLALAIAQGEACPKKIVLGTLGSDSRRDRDRTAC